MLFMLSHICQGNGTYLHVCNKRLESGTLILMLQYKFFEVYFLTSLKFVYCVPIILFTNTPLNSVIVYVARISDKSNRLI